MIVDPPSISQQYALAYAPKCFSALSFISSAYLLYHLLCEQPGKRKRMYHRIVLATNVSSLGLACATFWGSWAVPKGTPDFVGASGTVQTCTAQGFLQIVFGLSVTIYFASLSIYSFVAIKNNFQEAKYKWIEKWIYAMACLLPLFPALLGAMTENINPFLGFCFLIAFPLGCDDDPGVECERGNEHIAILTAIHGIALVVFLFVLPPAVMLSVRRLIKRSQDDMEVSKGMKLMIESARKRMLRDMAIQTGLYLISFWSTYILVIPVLFAEIIFGKLLYNLSIVALSCLASQGFVLMLVYFKLQRKTNPAPLHCAARSHKHQTVSDIRSKAESKPKRRTRISRLSGIVSNGPGSLTFSIFDGTPTEGSPWAQYLDPYLDEEIDEQNSVGTQNKFPDEERKSTLTKTVSELIDGNKTYSV